MEGVDEAVGFGDGGCGAWKWSMYVVWKDFGDNWKGQVLTGNSRCDTTTKLPLTTDNCERYSQPAIRS